MIYSEFINKVSKYLKSVRVLKNYISFDFIFPSDWVMLKKLNDGIERLENDTQDGNIIYSFVCENKKDIIDKVEKIFDTTVRTNIEREEKERLFKNKVQELKNIFEKEKLETLKGLKFDVEELTKFIENETEQINTGVEEGVESVK